MEKRTGNSDAQFRHFTAEQTNLIKGVGILMIVLHNFYHNLTPTLGENEFAFGPNILANYWTLLVVAPENVLRVLLSYLGHYGVQIFVFFNAYGVYRKYGGAVPDAPQFIRSRISKLYMTFLLCVAIYVALGLFMEHVLGREKLIFWDSLLWKVLLVSNFVPDAGLSPVGPWWYVPFAIQLYLLLPLILRGFEKFGAALLLTLAGVALLTEWALNPYLMSRGLNINFTILGHMSVICLGIWLASRQTLEISAGWMLAAWLAFAAGNLNRHAWLLSDLSFIVMVLALCVAVLRARVEMPLLRSCLAFYGGLSLHLFLVNGFLRTPFHAIAEAHHQAWLDNAMALSSLLFGTASAFAFSKFDAVLRQRVFRRP